MRQKPINKNIKQIEYTLGAKLERHRIKKKWSVEHVAKKICISEKYINAIEQCVGKKAIKNFMPMQDGDVSVTSSDCSKIEKWINFRPRTSIKEGINQFVSWYREYHEI